MLDSDIQPLVFGKLYQGIIALWFLGISIRHGSLAWLEIIERYFIVYIYLFIFSSLVMYAKISRSNGK